MTVSAPKNLEWTPERLARFWDYCSSRPRASEEYFSAQFGRGVVAFLGEVGDLRDCDVLDYGCGPGYLAEQLLDAGARVAGADFSGASVEQANARFARQPGWIEARRITEFSVPWDDASFRIVCCLETIEHVLEDQLCPLFQEIRRLLKPDGLVVLTTPNAEDLERMTVYCPHCNHEFHRWQHVRKWTAEMLTDTLKQEGFQPVFCRGVNFASFQNEQRFKWHDISPRILVGGAKARVNGLLDKLFPRPFPEGRAFQQRVSSHRDPHLVAVARRRSE